MACATNVDHVNKACSAMAATKVITTSQAICMAWRLAFSNTRNRAPRFGRRRCGRTGAALERTLFFFPDVSASLEQIATNLLLMPQRTRSSPKTTISAADLAGSSRLDEAKPLFD
ncbi:hypothetical protein RGR602_PC01701 (plasmid) [Rhizobium gallicum bv. gallicum R602sp]|uniref:Uncharacterized protein n=2 Tax=Rhizobium/Agrobacterium group TaxID=227290 RepID=A0A0B4XG28_9HYPH|nr:hypothetical protein RGR602_PC01701 [Rhizobium gallicum bv. gallicum R602sp]